MAMLNFRRPKCVIMKEDVSWSGKYKVFFGHHFVVGRKCFDVGAINQLTGTITCRHYNETRHGNEEYAKAEALRIYDALVKNMKRRPEHEESETNNPFLADEYRRQLKRGLS